MRNADEGFCGECRGLTHAASADAKAECGHRTTYLSMRWCFACALMKGVCRRCGAFTRLPTAGERPGSSDDP